ncbi:hypothetical protein B0I72DRAFT_137337 [Yarrowia lipolytica]|jgi:cation diffusion facilitator CzcD-associated flavoprotein CzcO|uniref:YALI0E08162p n=2 Tax=Yarrowia lipolytica TaxID=4952 RepID=Q6C6M6_YARLI|nr:YALI0E08162p [Yarrowia lipolytica CLIB122]QNQ00281.1 Baeyer-Villiger monooxygenase [Yarrowia lipolytica]RDW25474.1 hypothetical protein B0I71DRAFT_132574 [Yarrowia lipolytica]RDW32878.1 hypothetical protein B0I72DRAFT_137337 [Yarrowia lipolytica]RDW40607.1 hypothetical protein B0I73DRAFT_130075 [Yarrowia lipolytica]RDW48226.1 hypothetical protein B0I74DRAFT_133868 [Yarrowia lipolytica]|eukprot:XP_503686.1 YALI0E08162p [Yarrowia lipolytica CLIB122]
MSTVFADGSLFSNVLILGTGFSGLATSIKLRTSWKEADFHLYDRDHSWGGTWAANTYPGCGSDIPAIWYCLTSDPKGDWSKAFPPRDEIYDYIQKLVAKYELRHMATFRTEIEGCKWNADEKLWYVNVRSLETGKKWVHKCRVLFTCKGGLVEPNRVQIEGLYTDFKGPVMHTARWDHSVDYTNKNVVVIGNGCSAIQVIAAIHDQTKTLTQFARTPQWITPRPEFVPGRITRFIFTRFPFVLHLLRTIVFFVIEAAYPMFKKGWLGTFIRRIRAHHATQNIRKKSPEKYWKVLKPDYEFACKRLIFDCGYLGPALNNPNMELTFDRVVKVESNKVITKDGNSYPADIIIDATGFDLSGGFTNIPFIGEHGVSLEDFWANGRVSAYETVLVPNFPNNFLIFGPNSATGHNSVLFAIENAIKFCESVGVKKLISGETDYIGVRAEAYDRWIHDVDSSHAQGLLQQGGCQSWYLADNGRNATTYPWSQLTAWLRARWIDKNAIVIGNGEKKTK